MIAGALERGNRPATEPARALGEGATARDAGALRLAWSGAASAHEEDGVVAVLDGFLVGRSPGVAEIARRWRSAGSRLARELRGAFTVVVWDEREGRGMVACDQFSLRICLMAGGPGGTLRFSTHLPTLRRMLPATPGPEPAVIAPWIAPQWIQGHRTMLAGVERIGGGRLLELDGSGWRRRRYWAPEWGGTIDASWAELVELLRAELSRAVRERTQGAERVGTILSGGVDSSVVLATAAGLEPRPDLRAYSAVFPAWPAADESERIVATREALGIPGASFAVRPQGALRLALEQLRDSGTVPGGPGGLVEHPGASQAADDGVSVLLDGQGGDEVFGSSPYLLADRLRRGNLRGAARLARMFVPYRRRRRDKVRDAVHALREFGVEPGLPRQLRRLVEGRPPHGGPAWLSERSRTLIAEANARWPWLTDERVPRWWAYHSYLLSDHVEGSGLGEHMWERGLRYGLRSGAPLFDVELVELVLRMPPDVKWRPLDRALARATVEGRLPDSVRLNRAKANIGPFYLDLMTGPDGDVMRELLLDPGARIREFADARWIDENVPRRPTPADPDWLMWTTVIWRLATAECWLNWLEEPDFPDRVLERSDLPVASAERDRV